MPEQYASKPQLLTDTHLVFLNRLRKSGIINMMAAPAVLRQAFPNLTKEESYAIFKYWVATF